MIYHTKIYNNDMQNWMWRILKSSDKFAFDLETTSLSINQAKILSISFSVANRQAMTISWDFIDKSSLMDIMLSNKLKIGQNTKYDLGVLLSNGINSKGPYADTALMHHLLYPEKKHGLKHMAREYTDCGDYEAELEIKKKEICKEKKIKKADFTYDLFGRDLLFTYANYDADVTMRLYNLFLPLLEKQGLLPLYYTNVIRYMEMALEMEYNGIRVDRYKLKALDAQYKIKIQELYNNITEDEEVKKFEKILHAEEVTRLENKWENSSVLKKRQTASEYVQKRLKKKNCKLNINSSPQLQRLFFNQLRLKPIDFSKKTGNPSVDTKLLKQYSELGIEIATKILEYRDAYKLLNTYISNAYDNSEFDNKLHTSYLQTGTITGRLTARGDINLQVMPRNAKEFKQCFIAEPGYIFVKADLGQAEFRNWANCSGDYDIVKAIKEDLDIHGYMASKVFECAEEEVTKEQRTASKATVFGLIYGSSEKSIANRTGLPIEKVHAIVELFFGSYPKATQWLSLIVEESRKTGVARSLLGRIRHLPNINLPPINKHNRTLMAQDERYATNTPIQALASDMNNRYMVEQIVLARMLGISCFPVGTVHDANFVQVQEDKVQDFIWVAKYVVETLFPEFICPMKLDVEIGYNLGELKEERNEIV